MNFRSNSSESLTLGCLGELCSLRAMTTELLYVQPQIRIFVAEMQATLALQVNWRTEDFLKTHKKPKGKYEICQ